VGRQSPQAKSPQNRTETDLDPDQFEAAVRAPIKDHIGDTCHTLARCIDDLRVEHVTDEQDLVLRKRISCGGDCEHPGFVISVHADTGGLEALYCRPGQQQACSTIAPNEDSLDHLRARLIVEATGEVCDPADHLAIGSHDFLASHLTKGEHSYLRGP
jgi:hypothetical protein